MKNNLANLSRQHLGPALALIAVLGGLVWLVGPPSRKVAAQDAPTVAGDLDLSFVPGVSRPGEVYAIALQPDGKILLGGLFLGINDVARGGIARLNADGTLDTAFGNGLAGVSIGSTLAGSNPPTVRAVAVQPDGKVIIGGNFGEVNGIARGSVARLNADGTLDTAFGNGLMVSSGGVGAVALQPDGKIIIGGGFFFINDVARGGIARLNADGTLDTAFGNGLVGVGTSLGTRAIALQPDGKVVIGGTFTNINGTPRGYIARLNADGTLDTAFGNGLAGANNTVTAAVLQPDGKVLIGGLFTSVNGTARNGIARLNANGTLDTTFGNGTLSTRQ